MTVTMDVFFTYYEMSVCVYRAAFGPRVALSASDW